MVLHKVFKQDKELKVTLVNHFLVVLTQLVQQLTSVELTQLKVDFMVKAVMVIQ